jgi:hypothetical protein
MNIEIKIEEILDELLLLTSKGEYSDEIEKAYELYMKGLPEGTIELGFNNWLIFDYKFENGSSFIQEYYKNSNLNEVEISLLEAIENSTFSVFKVIETDQRKFLKDVFTREDYIIDNENRIDRDPIIARIINFDHKNIIIEVIEKWAETSEKGIKQAILKKYNEIYAENRNMDIGEFVQNNAIIIYKYLMIYKDVEIKSVFEDEEYYVYQSKYKILESDEFHQAINESKAFVFQTDEFKNEIYELYEDNIVLAEIEIINDKFNVECRSQEELDQANLKLENILSDSVLKLKDEVLNIEDLISGR